MFRKVIAVLLVLTGGLFSFGGIGHSFIARKAIDTGLATLPIDAHTDKLIYLVWYFCGGCMLVFGLLIIWSTWRAVRGGSHALWVSGTIGLFYVLTGSIARGYMREPFWGVFVALGSLSLVLSGLLRFASDRAASERAVVVEQNVAAEPRAR